MIFKLEPYVVIRDSVIIGEGTWIKEFTCIYSRATIGKSCKIRAQCVICEDAIIGDFVEFGVGVQLMDHYKMCAFVKGEEDFVAAPLIADGCRIGSNSQLYAGCRLYPNVILLPNSIVLENQVVTSGLWGMRDGKLVKIRDLKENEII